LIDPGTNLDGEKYLDYNNRRWGGDYWTRDLYESAKMDNINQFCKFNDWKIWPNTIKAF